MRRHERRHPIGPAQNLLRRQPAQQANHQRRAPTVAGANRIGPRHALAGEDLDAWARDLAAFEIDILRDGEALDHGRAANVLDGPLAALRHFVGLLAADPVNPGIAAGEVVTTGTLTKAFPVAPGQVWSTRLHGLPLAGIRLALG